MQYRPSVLRTPTLQFITDGPQEGFAFGDVGVPFDTLGRETVDDPQDTPSLALSAMITSTGLAVAQKMRHTSVRF